MFFLQTAIFLKKDGDSYSREGTGCVCAGFSIGCMLYRHPVKVITQKVKFPVLVVYVVSGKSVEITLYAYLY